MFTPEEESVILSSHSS